MVKKATTAQQHKEPSQRLTVYLPVEMYKRVRIAAIDDGQSVTELVKGLIDRFLRERKR